MSEHGASDLSCPLLYIDSLISRLELPHRTPTTGGPMRDVRHVPAALSDLSRDARRSGVAARPDLAGAGAGRRPSAVFGPARRPSRPLFELLCLRSRMPVGRAVWRDHRRRARRARAAAPRRAAVAAVRRALGRWHRRWPQAFIWSRAAVAAQAA